MTTSETKSAPKAPSNKKAAVKVGIFTALGLGLMVVFTILVNNRPFWWRPCQLVKINVEDATGLKSKAPIRSLGIEIGYLKSVVLTETHVTLGICVTAPVEVLPATRAYIRGEGFLGDKFVELKPVKYVGPNNESGNESFLKSILFSSAYAAPPPASATVKEGTKEMGKEAVKEIAKDLEENDPVAKEAIDNVNAANIKRKKSRGREIPVGSDAQDVQHLVTRVDDLVQQMSSLTGNLKQAINPEELHRTMKQLNQTLENASRTLAPEGGLNQTAQRSLAKLEDAIEQLRDQMTRMNKGEGSVGMLLNDPVYADEIRQAIQNVNRLLNRVSDVRFVVDIGAMPLTIYNGTRGFLQIAIWPKKDRYYLLGIAGDPRGRLTNITTTTTVGGLTQTTQTLTSETTALMLTGMIGKVFWNRVDLSIGALYNDGAFSAAFRLGPNGAEDKLELRNDVYSRSAGGTIDDRVSLTLKPFNGMLSGLYAKAGIESVAGYRGQMVYFYGGGLRFDDEDIKILFSLR